MNSLEKQIIDAEYRSLFYKFLSMAVLYPNEKLLSSINNDSFWTGLSDVLSAFGCLENCKELISQRDEICNELKNGSIELEMEYNRLFQLSQQFACPLTASEYLPGESRQAMAVAQLKGLYKAFGLQIRPVTEADHLSVLLEFMSFLYAKTAHALNKDDQNEAAQCSRAIAIVLEDFLGWLPLFLSTVKLNGQMKFYPWITSLLTEFLRSERQAILSTKEGASR